MTKSIKRPFVLFCFVSLTAIVFMMLTDSGYIILPLIACAAVCLILCLRASAYATHFLIVTAAITVSALIFLSGLTYPAAYAGLSLKGARVTGTIYEINPETESSYAYVLKDYTVNGTAFKGYLQLYTSDQSQGEEGDRVEFTASEIFSEEYEGIFKYHSLSERSYLTAFTREAPSVTAEAEKSDIVSKINKLKRIITQKFFDNMEYDNAAVATALITGNKDYLSEEIALSLKISGVSHIFAVSGMHLSIWTGIFFIIFRQRARSAVIPNIAAIVFVIFFCIFTGFTPSVLRSGIMLITVFSAKLFRRQADGLNSLGIAGSVLLCANPFLAGNVSFLLSFSATFAIIWFSEFIIPQLSVKPRKRLPSPCALTKKLADGLLISLAVILTTLPITAVFFGYVSLLSPVTGIIITPLAEAVMLLSLLAGLFPAGNMLSYVMFSLAELPSSAITALTGYFSRFEEAIVSVHEEIIIPWYIASVLIIFTVYALTKNKKNLLICILAGVAVLLSAASIHSVVHKNETKLYIPEGNNATTVAVVCESGKETFIYGTGGDYSTVSKITSYLNASGSFEADAIIIPRSQKTENFNTEYYLKKIFPRNVISAYSENETTVSEFNFGDTYVYCRSSEDFCAAAIVCGNTKAVICSLPYSDFAHADAIFTQADVLICRSAVPQNADTDNYKEIIIMTDSPYRGTDLTVSTRNGDTEIILKGDSYAVNR